MDLSKIVKMVSIAVALFGLNSWQEKELDNYVKLNMMTWKEEMRREEEIDQYIKAEAARISSGS